PLTLILAGVQVGAGLLVGRWWALALPLVAVGVRASGGDPGTDKGEAPPAGPRPPACGGGARGSGGVPGREQGRAASNVARSGGRLSGGCDPRRGRCSRRAGFAPVARRLDSAGWKDEGSPSPRS